MLHANGTGYVTDTGIELGVALGNIVDAMDRYLISFSECKHGFKPSVCNVCLRPVLNDPKRWGFNRNASDLTNAIALAEYEQEQAERLRNMRKFFARNKPVRFDPDAYGNPADSQTVTAQSFSRRPLKFGGNDRVLSDQNKFGSRAERASQKHHEDGELRKYYGHNERTWDAKHNRYSSTPDSKLTKVPRGDHYMER